MTSSGGGTHDCINCTCPACGQVLAGAAFGPDRRVSCSECGHVFAIQAPRPPAGTLKSLSIAAINAACPNCGCGISNAVISASNTVQCQACKGIFFVRIRQRPSQIKMKPVQPAAVSGPRPSNESSRGKLDAAGAPPSAFTAELDPADVPTGDYSPAQFAAIAYDCPERVALSPLPASRHYRSLRWAGAGAAAAVCLSAAVHVLWGAAPETAVPAALHWLSAGLDAGLAVLLAAALVMLCGYLPRLDARANWLAWRSASILDQLFEPPGSALSLLAPACAAGLFLLACGVILALRTAGAGSDQAHGWTIASAGALLLILLPGCAELRHFFCRMAQLGKALSQRKRGDEVGLPPVARVQASEQTSSAVLVLMAMAFLAAGFAIYVWHCFQPVQTALGSVLIALGFAGILGGAHTLHRLAVFWSDMLYGWEWGARSIGRPLAFCNGRAAAQAFSAAAVTLSVCIVALVIPVMKTAGNSSLPAMLLAIFLPAAGILFLLWMAALKKDTFRFVTATTAVAGAQAFEAAASVRVQWLVRALAAVAVLQTCAAFLNTAFVLNHLWQGRLPAAAGGAAVTILTVVLKESLVLMSAVWAGLTLLDADRAAANLDACRETEAEVLATA